MLQFNRLLPLLAFALIASSHPARASPGAYLSGAYRASLVAKYIETDPEALLEIHLSTTVLNDERRDAIRSILQDEESRAAFVERVEAAESRFWSESQVYYSITGEFPRGGRRVVSGHPPLYVSEILQRIGSIARGERELPLRSSALDGEVFELALRGLIEELDEEEIERLGTLVQEHFVQEACDEPRDLEFLYAAYLNQTNDLGLIEKRLSFDPDFVPCFESRIRSILSGVSHENEEARDLLMNAVRYFAHDPEYRGWSPDHESASLTPLLYDRRNDREVTDFIVRDLLNNREQGTGRFTGSTRRLLMILRDSDVATYTAEGVRLPIHSAERILGARGLTIMDEYKIRPEGFRYPAPE